MATFPRPTPLLIQERRPDATEMVGLATPTSNVRKFTAMGEFVIACHVRVGFVLVFNRLLLIRQLFLTTPYIG